TGSGSVSWSISDFRLKISDFKSSDVRDQNCKVNPDNLQSEISNLPSRKYVLQDVAALAKFGVGEGQRRQQSQHRAVGTVDEQAPHETGVDEGRGVDGQLDADHHA